MVVVGIRRRMEHYMTIKHKAIRRAAAAALGAAAIIAVPSGVATADPGIGWGAPGPGILPGLGLGGFGGPASGLGLLPGAGFGLPGVGLGGVGGPGSGLGVLPGLGLGLPGPGLF
jgi:hypothetical protein